MSDLRIASSSGAYLVRFTASVATLISDELRAGDVVIIDSQVADEYRGAMRSALGEHPVIEVAADEPMKSYRGVEVVIEQLLAMGFRKDGRLVAIGGGVVQDVTGFVASIMFRGVHWWFVPTTLLAQCDSCIGSKTSINFRQFKNQLGGFFPPDGVLVDGMFLRSLPESEMRSGLGEMAHYFLVSGWDDFERFRKESLIALEDLNVLNGLVRRSLEIKKWFIEIDEFDRNERQVLNYGHSFGHALESVLDFALPHGIAVAWGMDIANFVSVELGMLSDLDRRSIRQGLEPIWRPFPAPDVGVDEMLTALRRDKKNVGTQFGLILSRGPGRMEKRLIDDGPDFADLLGRYFKGRG